MHFKSSIGAFLLALASVAQTQGSITPSLNGDAPTSLGNGQFRYTYTATVDPLQNMTTGTATTGDFLTLYDLTGFTGNVVVPTGFSFTTQSIGVNPTGPPAINPIEEPGLINLTIRNTSGTTLLGQTTFTFSFTSTQSVTDYLQYAAQGTLKRNGLPQSNGGQVLGPAAVPEPSVTVMVGLASVLGLGVHTIRRKRTTS